MKLSATRHVGGSFRKTGILSLLLFSISLALPNSIPAYSSFNADSKHNFVDNGYTGGGVCSECHAAGGGAADSRLFNWNLSGSDPGMCLNKCHGASPSLPMTDPGWANVTGVTPISAPHDCVNGRCEWCHNQNVEVYKCLDCHAPGISDTLMCRTPQNFDSGTIADPSQTEVSKFFTGISGFSPMAGLLSSHNIKYNTTGTLSSPTDNECLKCHGVGAATVHPGLKINSAILEYPDDPDGAGPLVKGSKIIAPHLNGTTNTTPAAWNAYYKAKRQDFCLACHDGRVDEAGALITLNGVSVPAVPKKNYNSGGPNYTTGVPYFADTGTTKDNYPAANYYVNNGHGMGSDSRNLPLALTCLGEEVKDKEADNGGTTGITVGAGCHSAHGTANYSLIRDTVTEGSVNLGTAVNTAEELTNGVCLGCHTRTTMRNYPSHVGFHVWMGYSPTSRMIHLDGACDNAGDYSSVHWRKLPPATATRPGNNMSTGVTLFETLMPYFNARNADLVTGRIYGSQTFDSNDCTQSAGSTGSVIACITCHDPHGTFSVYQQGDVGVPGTYGMVRWPTADFQVYPGSSGTDPVDPLCSKCHI